MVESYAAMSSFAVRCFGSFCSLRFGWSEEVKERLTDRGLFGGIGGRSEEAPLVTRATDR